MNNENMKEIAYSVTVRQCEAAIATTKPTPKINQRRRGKGSLVSLTVRLSRADWERVHRLAVMDGCSIQKLAVDGLSSEFVKRGLSPLDNSD